MSFKSLSFFNKINEDSEFIPIIDVENDEDFSHEQNVPDKLPILSLRNTILFPGVVLPITASRDKSIRLIEEAADLNKIIGVVSQKNVDVEDPDPQDLNTLGTVAKILKVIKMPDGSTTVILQGKVRFKLGKILQEDPYIKAEFTVIKDIEPAKKTKTFKALIESVKDLALEVIKENPNIPSEASFAIKNIEGSSFLVNFTAANMDLPLKDKQRLLEEDDIKERGVKTLEFLSLELQKLKLKNDIQTKVRTDLDQQQKEYFLHQQMKTIQEELGGVSYEVELEELRNKAKSKKWTKEVGELFEKELVRLQRMNPQVAEYSIQRNYLETLLELPWGDYSKDNFDLKNAQKVLDKEHYGLEDVKDRIIEYLAVLKLKGDMKSPIICLYGPPGVGKTSLGKSVAEALNRKYVRMSLGGLRDEAEIRGHRKTYIGAMPGRIVQSIKKAKTSNPVFVLDEIDKLGNSHQGDPSSAMLEVLDPEQNTSFYDNFLETGYDLSKILFIATANNLSNVQPALRDRMEAIEINGYTIEEKIEIAKRHLVPKQIKAHGLKFKDLSIGKKEIEKIIDGYTRESGVRGLDKKIAKLVRKTAKYIAMEEKYDKKVSVKQIEKALGVPHLERDKYRDNNVAGVVTGLAWTSVGGDILFIESILHNGKGKMTITGNLGNVMKESATIAMKYIKSNCHIFGIQPEVFDKWDIHIHVPEGATPKDGPSAGITMITSMVSSLTQRKVKSNVAMTGEITLRGKVLPVGGIKEKILAAKRSGIKEIILCENNKKDIEEIKSNYLKGLKFHYVDKINEVIDIALMQQKVTYPKKLLV